MTACVITCVAGLSFGYSLDTEKTRDGDRESPRRDQWTRQEDTLYGPYLLPMFVNIEYLLGLIKLCDMDW